MSRLLALLLLLPVCAKAQVSAVPANSASSTSAAEHSNSNTSVSVRCLIRESIWYWKGKENRESKSEEILISADRNVIYVNMSSRDPRIFSPWQFDTRQYTAAFITGHYKLLRSGGNFKNSKGGFFIDRTRGAGYFGSTKELTDGDALGEIASEDHVFERCQVVQPKF